MEKTVVEEFREKKNEYIELLSNISIEMFHLLVTSIHNSTEIIMNGTLGYLNQAESHAMTQFYELYQDQFKTIVPKADKINRDIDDIVKDLKDKQDKGELLDFNDEGPTKTERLGITGIQKQLEVIARLDSGIKEKITPLLQELQCEDILRQKVEHLAFSLSEFQKFAAGCVLTSDQDIEVGEFLSKIFNAFTMFEERRIFYREFYDKEITDEKEQQDDLTFF